MKRSTLSQNPMRNHGKSIAASNKPAPQNSVTKASNRISLEPIKKSAPESLTRTRRPKAEASANSQSHVSKLTNKRGCEIENADKRQASTVKRTFSRPLVKESSLQAERGPLKKLQPINLSHRPLRRMCSDAVASPATIGPLGTKGQQDKTAVLTQPRAGRRDPLLESIRLMRRPPWRMGAVLRDVPLPRLKLRSSEGYQPQPGSPCLRRLRGDRGRRAGRTAPLEENPESFKHQNWLMPISEPTSASASCWEESARPNTPALYLLSRALPRKGVRQRHGSFTLQARTEVPRLPEPNSLDLSQVPVPLHLPNYPYGKVHLTLPAACCPTSLCGGDHGVRQVTPSESDPEYSSDYEDESSYESDSDFSR
ncbi:uncharacterized protein LOC134079511 [Sardina pilchardus]|uniref:uncharacterized protein LOC134079511 n=1 Tax=Sardina pilchardus TaxID=27697 RepID=UPI002E10ED0C